MAENNEVTLVADSLGVSYRVALALYKVLGVTSRDVFSFVGTQHPKALAYLRQGDLMGFRFWNPEIDDSRYYGMCAVVEGEIYN